MKFIVAHGKTFEIKLDNKYEKKSILIAHGSDANNLIPIFLISKSFKINVHNINHQFNFNKSELAINKLYFGLR